jgi:hypothetical protein
MAEYKIAHIQEHGQDMIIVPLESAFHSRSAQDKEAFRLALRRCAASANLKGDVCLAWTYGGRFYSLAPQPWRPFFKSIGMDYVHGRINRKLTCDFG